MVTLTTGPVDRGTDTDRVVVLVSNKSRCTITVNVVLRRTYAKPARRCTCSLGCRYEHSHRDTWGHCDAWDRYERFHWYDRFDCCGASRHRCVKRGSRSGREGPRPERRHSKRRGHVIACRRRVRSGHTATFDAALGHAIRYEVRIHSPSHHILVYVSGYRPERWWPWRVHDPSTTFRHRDMVCIGSRARYS